MFLLIIEIIWQLQAPQKCRQRKDRQKKESFDKSFARTIYFTNEAETILPDSAFWILVVVTENGKSSTADDWQFEG